jgi:hypothetical protein
MPLSDYINPCTFNFESDKPIDILQQMRTEIIRKALIDKGYQEIAELEDFHLINRLKILYSQFEEESSQEFYYKDAFIVEISINPKVSVKHTETYDISAASARFKVRR